MKKINVLLALLFISTIGFAQAPNLIQLINDVSLDSLKLYNRQLSGDTSCVIGGANYTIVSRHKNQPGNDKAAQFIYEKFLSYGLTAKYDSFSTTGKNVIGTKLGTQYPNQYYIICAHFDDMPSGTTAPGADDNASGTAAVMELARVFSKYSFKYTVKFMAWDEEEQGLVGSNFYATQARNRNDSILAVINLDMIAYDNNNDGKCDVHSKSVANTVQIANDFIANITQYSIPLVPRVVASQPYSDHDSFLKKNYGAILIIEDDNEFNPRYHTVNDKYQYNNMPYAHRITQVTGVTIAEYAQMNTGTYVNINTFDGWNLLSVPLDPTDNKKTSLFSSAVSYAYTYNGNYSIQDTMVLGRGYWLKFNGDQSHAIQGEVKSTAVVGMNSGWNLVGGLNSDVSVAAISTNPPGILSSQFFEYNMGYAPVTALKRGKGYWINTNQSGTMTLSTSTFKNHPEDILSKFDFDCTLTIEDASGKIKKLFLTSNYSNHEFLLPPIPPNGVFDIRFFDDRFAANSYQENLIKLNSVSFPVKIELNSKSGANYKVYSNMLDETFSQSLGNGQTVIIHQTTELLKIKPALAPTEYSLGQNYPNPFNSQTTINYTLAKYGNVKISLINSIGQVVKELIDANQNAGSYKLNLNGDDLASGIYLIKLKTSDLVLTNKCILLK